MSGRPMIVNKSIEKIDFDDETNGFQNEKEVANFFDDYQIGVSP